MNRYEVWQAQQVPNPPTTIAHVYSIEFAQSLRYDISWAREFAQGLRESGVWRSIANQEGCRLPPEHVSHQPRNNPTRDRAAHRQETRERTNHCNFRDYLGYGQGQRRRS